MNSPVIETINGQLKGTTDTDIYDSKFYSFLGIPYAKPPVGALRFKAPLPAEPWEGIRDATKEGNQCVQRAQDPTRTGFDGSEDCLCLNVFTKTLPSEKNELKPVMVYIHGGAFMNGSGNAAMYGPRILMTEDIVLVTINYRVGVLGFLSLSDTSLEVPGNAGLKDQTLALKWVKQNIKFFNGDPENITVFGESAGGASVHYHILSPSSKGLFHKAIVQSGTAFSPWAYSDPNANDFVKYLDISVTNEKLLLKKLREVPVEEILKAQEKFSDEKQTLGFCGPIIEKPNDTAFMTKEAIDVIRSGEYNKVPVIFGFTNNEGLLEVFLKILNQMQGKPYKESTMEDYIPWQVDLKPGSDERKLVIEKMNAVYEGKNKGNPYLASSDSLFITPTIVAVHNHVKVQEEPIYLYRMSVITARNFLSRRMKLDPNLGVCHGDDIGYLFSNASMTDEISKGSPEEVGIKRFVKLWTNFAKYGNPTPDQNELGVLWKHVELNSRTFLDIGDELVVGENPEPERMELWKEIFQMSPKTASFLQ